MPMWRLKRQDTGEYLVLIRTANGASLPLEWTPREGKASLFSSHDLKHRGIEGKSLQWDLYLAEQAHPR